MEGAKGGRESSVKGRREGEEGGRNKEGSKGGREERN